MSWIERVFSRGRLYRDLSEEIQTHLEERTEELVAKGMSKKDAAAAARREFGNVTLVEERSREVWRWPTVEDFLMDVRYGLRQLRRSPGFAAVAILTLALGIGANTAIFSLVNAVLMRPLPYRDSDRLVKIVFSLPGIGLQDVRFSVPELEDLRSKAGVFEDVSVAWPVSVNLTGGRQPERLELLAVCPNYFDMLGAAPQIGRLFGSQDSAPGFAPAVVLSDGVWRRSFGADPGILGRSLRLDNDLYTVVGVLPAGFRHPGKTVARDVEVWATAGFSADPFPKPTRSARLLPGAVGKLKSGLSLEQAQARLTVLASELRSEFPADYRPEGRWTIEVQSLKESLVRDTRPMLLVLLGAVVLTILIASANIANLLLARACGRQREMAVRLAIGASRTRMIRQMLTESLILSLIAGAAGVLTVSAALDLIVRFVPSGIPRLSEVRVDWAVVGFALLISVLTGVVFGLAPAIQSTKADLSLAIREGARGSGESARTNRLRGLLILSELALAVVLTVGAGLLLRTFWRLVQEPPGFNPSGIVTASIWLPVPNDPKADPYQTIPQQAAFIRETLRRLSGIPGVEAAAISSVLPASSQTYTAALVIEDRPVESSQDLRAEPVRATPDYLKVLQSPMVRGRFFDEHDEADKQRVAIIDETTARRYWADGDPIGRRLRLGQDPNQPWLTVVGVVPDIKYDGLDSEGVPHVYLPEYQYPSRVMNVVLRTSLPAAGLEPQIRSQLQAVDAGLPVFNVCSMDDVIGVSLASRRFAAGLVGAFAGLALLLASIGIYGLLAYMVGQRSLEIGIRVALGAQPADIRKLILGQGLSLAGTGILVGLLLAAAAAPMIAALLYGVQPIDPAVFLTVPLVLLAAAGLASYIPARRAAKVDPILALREG
jgi:putative ABC transport system permease protein